MDYAFAIFAMIYIGLIILAIFGFQLLAYWLIHKYVLSSFTVGYRVIIAGLVTAIITYMLLK